MVENVLLLMIDAFRGDQAYGPARQSRTPALDELARNSTVFTRAFSTASVTTCCTASLLTGSYPFIHGIRSLADHRLRSDIPTLAEAFQASGYFTWAEVTGPLIPATGLDRGFGRYRHRDSTLTLDTAWGEEFLSGLKDLPEPWFGFVHLWELHNPRRVMAAYDRAEYGRNLYERAVSSLDSQLSRLFDALGDSAQIVLTGDHGEYIAQAGAADWVSRMKRGFKWMKRWVPGAKKLRRVSPAMFETMDRLGQRNNELYYSWMGHGFHVYDSLVNVPLIYYRPGVTPTQAEVAQLASHVDIFPTLASALKLSEGKSSFWSGIDLLPFIQNGQQVDREIFMESSGGRTKPRTDQWLAALRTDRYKYVRGLFNGELPVELYDLTADPGERQNLANRLPDVAGSLYSRLTEIMQPAVSLVESQDAYTEEEYELLQKHLRSLGYLE